MRLSSVIVVVRRLLVAFMAEIDETSLTLRTSSVTSSLTLIDLGGSGEAHAVRAVKEGNAVVNDPLPELVATINAGRTVPAAHGRTLATLRTPVVNPRAGLKGNGLRTSLMKSGKSQRGPDLGLLEAHLTRFFETEPMPEC